jgi:hypothetical protein
LFYPALFYPALFYRAIQTSGDAAFGHHALMDRADG